MSIEWITIIMFGAMIFLMLLGMPVAFSTGAVGVICMVIFQGPEAINLIPQRIFGIMTNYLLGAIPLFIVMATIFVERDSHKAMVIGEGGAMLKKIGTTARKSIEEMSGRKIFLELHVKVRKNWRNDPAALRQFGYSIEDDQ